MLNATLSAVNDISSAIKKYPLIGMLGWQDVRQRYRRSFLGPFWLTISMGVMIGTIGIVFGQIFRAPMAIFLPFLTVGIIMWTFISSVITEGCNGFIAANNLIKELPIPLSVHIMRLVWRNILIMLHNLIIFPVVLIAVGKPLSWTALYSLLGFVIVAANLSWMALLLGVFCTRYRDLPQIIASILQIFFYLTPIVWLPTLLPERAGLYLLDLNPFYHLIQLIREPLLGGLPSSENWLVALILLVAGWCATVMIFGMNKFKIAFWL